MTSIRNILAIAGKELRSYFASPIAYVIIGLFALLFGWFFYVYLAVFVEQSQRASMGGGRVNVNEGMIRGVMLNAAVIILFVMPMITMRTYSEEKRSGTIELLLTSPVTDLQIILGKFLGAMGLFCAMLLVTSSASVQIARMMCLGIIAASSEYLDPGDYLAEPRNKASQSFFISTTTQPRFGASSSALSSLPKCDARS